MLENVYVARWGSEGPPVVMIHGGAQGSISAGHRNFHAQEALGGDGFRLLVPDRPGHGQSADPGRPDNAEADGEWAAALIGDGAHVVGHSFGGLVALNAANRGLDKVKSITLIEPALLKIATNNWAVRKLLLKLASYMILPYSNATRSRKIMTLLGIPDVFARSDEELSKTGSGLKNIKLPSKQVMVEQLAAVKAAGIPLLIISGDWNPAFIATGEKAAEVGGGRHVVVPSEHHFPQWQGGDFNVLLLDHWRRADAR